METGDGGRQGPIEKEGRPEKRIESMSRGGRIGGPGGARGGIARGAPSPSAEARTAGRATLATDAEVDMQRAIVASVCVRAFTRLAAVPKIRRRRHVDARPRVRFFLGVDPEVFVTISRVHLGSLPVKGVWEAVTNRISIVPSPSPAPLERRNEPPPKAIARVGSQRGRRAHSATDDGGVITMSKREKQLRARCASRSWTPCDGPSARAVVRGGSRDDDGGTAIRSARRATAHKARRMLCDFIPARARRADARRRGWLALGLDLMPRTTGTSRLPASALDASQLPRQVPLGRKTAADYARGSAPRRARRRGSTARDHSEEEDTDDDDDVDPDAAEGETATQRSKRKKKELDGASSSRGGAPATRSSRRLTYEEGGHERRPTLSKAER